MDSGDGLSTHRVSQRSSDAGGALLFEPGSGKVWQGGHGVCDAQPGASPAGGQTLSLLTEQLPAAAPPSIVAWQQPPARRRGSSRRTAGQQQHRRELSEPAATAGRGGGCRDSAPFDPRRLQCGCTAPLSYLNISCCNNGNLPAVMTEEMLLTLHALHWEVLLTLGQTQQEVHLPNQHKRLVCGRQTQCLCSPRFMAA